MLSKRENKKTHLHFAFLEHTDSLCFFKTDPISNQTNVNHLERSLQKPLRSGGRAGGGSFNKPAPTTRMPGVGNFLGPILLAPAAIENALEVGDILAGNNDFNRDGFVDGTSEFSSKVATGRWIQENLLGMNLSAEVRPLTDKNSIQVIDGQAFIHTEEKGILAPVKSNEVIIPLGDNIILEQRGSNCFITKKTSSGGEIVKKLTNARIEKDPNLGYLIYDAKLGSSLTPVRVDDFLKPNSSPDSINETTHIKPTEKESETIGDPTKFKERELEIREKVEVNENGLWIVKPDGTKEKVEKGTKIKITPNTTITIDENGNTFTSDKNGFGLRQIKASEGKPIIFDPKEIAKWEKILGDGKDKLALAGKSAAEIAAEAVKRVNEQFMQGVEAIQSKNGGSRVSVSAGSSGGNFEGIVFVSNPSKLEELRKYIKENPDKPINLRGASLDGIDLSGLSLKNADLSNAILVKANLSNADLEGANLQNTFLSGANLSGANCKQVNFKDAKLQNANLTNANLEGAIFVKANLRGAILLNTKINTTTFDETQLTSLESHSLVEALNYLIPDEIGSSVELTSYQNPDDEADRQNHTTTMHNHIMRITRTPEGFRIHYIDNESRVSGRIGFKINMFFVIKNTGEIIFDKDNGSNILKSFDYMLEKGDSTRTRINSEQLQKITRNQLTHIFFAPQAQKAPKVVKKDSHGNVFYSSDRNPSEISSFQLFRTFVIERNGVRE